MNYAIKVEKVGKFYGKEKILDDISLTVEQGKIFGLLGASGCGKTTLLSCILGMRQWDDGEIHVFHRTFTPSCNKSHSCFVSKLVGYMPQDLALHSFLKISEELQYYGEVFGMSRNQIEEESENLQKLLQLPSTCKLIGKLSGGEQRRVSLACALIHKPKLLVLDEPTAGVDALLRESIWNYLRDISTKSKVTVVITTHYVEESRFCDTVGILRFGRMLIQDNPQTLIKRHGVTTLEQAVLRLCHNDGRLQEVDENFNVNVDLKHNVNDEENPNLLVEVKIPSVTNEVDKFSLSRNFHILLSLVTLNLHLISRNPVALMFQLFLPVMQLFLFYSIIGRDPTGLGFSVVNFDLMNSSHCYNHGSAKYSCKFLEHFDPKSFHWKFFNSEENALMSVKRGESTGVLTFPQNFTENLINRGVYGKFSDEGVISGSEVKLKMDMSNALTNVFVIRKMMENMEQFLEQIVHEMGGNVETVKIPLKFESVHNSAWGEGTWFDYVMPAMIIFSIFMLNVLAGVSHLIDKIAGTFERSKAGGVGVWHVIASHLLSGSMIIVLQILILLPPAIYLFGMNSRGSLLLAFLLVYVVAVAGLILGFLLATLCTVIMEFMMGVMAVNVSLIINQGLIWPMDGAPHLLQIVAKIIPTTIQNAALRAILNTGDGLSSNKVLCGFGLTFGWMVFSSLLIYIVLIIKRKKM